jgi:hypothetical protein
MMTDRYPDYLPAPRNLLATCDALRSRVIRLEDEIATKQRELDTFREILTALGWLCQSHATPVRVTDERGHIAPPLYSPGYPMEDAEQEDEPTVRVTDTSGYATISDDPSIEA